MGFYPFTPCSMVRMSAELYPGSLPLMADPYFVRPITSFVFLLFYLTSPLEIPELLFGWPRKQVCLVREAPSSNTLNYLPCQVLKIVAPLT